MRCTGIDLFGVHVAPISLPAGANNHHFGHDRLPSRSARSVRLIGPFARDRARYILPIIVEPMIVGCAIGCGIGATYVVMLGFGHWSNLRASAWMHS
jgi:hypothetical protein